MARWLTVLIALVAQGMALMSPVCLVRCVGADGHECVELAGRGCQRRDCQEHESQPQVSSVAKCCEQCHHNDEEEAPEGQQIAEQPCSCQHSPMEPAPQVQNKPLSSDVLLAWHDVLLAPTTFAVVVSDSSLEFVSLSLLRPQESLHLTVLATVVLRV